jgi:protein-S-isoprenylcysteine O-methyltransferase Ste14
LVRIGEIWYNINSKVKFQKAKLIMHTETQTIKPEIVHTKKPMNIHLILSRSYSIYFFAFIIALILDVVVNLNLKLGGQMLSSIGFALIILSTFLMYWAQTVNKKVYYLPDGSKDFTRGPYKYSRNPTQLGLFILVLGAGFMMNSYIISISAVVSLFFSAFFVIPEEESRHIRKHGEVYLKYMKKVRRLI